MTTAFLPNDLMSTPSTTTPAPATYDVVVVGGAVAGASVALLLKRDQPDLRILLVELRERFGHKVGEATVEVSGFFLERVLQLGDHLYREHLPKHGLRYWFAGSADDTLETMGEVGPQVAPHVPSFQLDRAKLDEHVLALAVEEGCELARPARVISFGESWPRSEIEIETLEEPRKRRRIHSRWLVDASGRHAFLARKKGLLSRLEPHPTAASWSRWTGTLDLDGPEFMGSPESPRLPRLQAQRRLATNHFTGEGWWCWVIPLSNGKTSVGLVYDKRLLDPQNEIGAFGTHDGTLPVGEERLDARARYERFVRAQPGLRQLLDGAEMCDDCMTYSFVPYRASQYMGRGWALVGDAASFIDPYYSPGLDHVAMSSYATFRILRRDLAGDLDDAVLDQTIEAHNTAFEVSYDRWFDALYRDKYKLLGDGELVTSSFLVETALYYLGVVTPILRNVDALANPVFGAPLPQSKIAYKMASAFRRRMVRLAELRKKRGLYGRRNRELRMYPKGFGLGVKALPALSRGLAMWLRLEAEQVLATVTGRKGPDEARDADLAAAPAAATPRSDRPAA